MIHLDPSPHPLGRLPHLAQAPSLNVMRARERTRLRVVASLIAMPEDDPLPSAIVSERLARRRRWR